MLKLFNSISRTKEPFHSIEPGHVRMYTCGPTVYDQIHIGNCRTFLFEDLLRRYLEYRDYGVTQVMNLTDVEDKVIRRAREQGTTLEALTERYTEAFFRDLDTLGIKRAETYPRATEHIPEMVAMIESLMEKGYAYTADDGSVYYAIRKFPRYGRLAHLDPEELEAGASGRVSSDEYDKFHAADFALWKTWTPEDGDVAWETSLGKGRPGWHIECSAMAMKYLGQHFDIHTGAVDNLFPHHENEIAQSEAVTGRKFVNTWMHGEHLLVDGAKMAKRFKNFYVLADLLGRGYRPSVIRYALLNVHYRQKLNFTFEVLDAAAEGVRRLRDFRDRVHEMAAGGVEGNGADAVGEEALQNFEAAMDDDLNISPALAALFMLVREGHRRADEGTLGRGGARRLLAALDRADRALGVLDESEASTPQNVSELIAQRQEARRLRDFAAADELRDQIAALGYIVRDTSTGPQVLRR